MFREEYRKAYENINPDRDSIDRILQRAATEYAEIAGRKYETLLTRESVWARKAAGNASYVAAILLMLCLLSTLTLTVAAQHIPAVYRIVEEYVPSLAEYILPEEISSTGKGITMQVEAIDIIDNTAEILLSFRDAEDSEENIIKGKIDLYDSFRLKNFGEEWSAGGAGFLEYDEAEGKAYYKVELTSSDAYSRSLVRLGVTQILTELTEEERAIDMTGLLKDPAEKVVHLSGAGGMRERDAFPFYEQSGSSEDPRPGCRVMDIAALEENLLETLTITGVAYDEGALRVQACRGNFANADRHVRTYLKDAAGNERVNDGSVSWQEEICGQPVLFEEQWFLISEEELANYDLYGMFYITDGAVKGNWEVTFRLN